MISRRLSKVRELGRKSLRNHGEQPLIDLDELAYSEDLVLGDWLPPPRLARALAALPNRD